MIDKNMPELLFVEILPFDIDYYPDGDVFTYTGSTDSEIVKNPVEYIRADLVTGDANEPMEAGQCRWVRITKDSDWCVAEIRKGWIDPMALVYFACGDEVEESVDDCYEWGPVIRPPVDKNG